MDKVTIALQNQIREYYKLKKEEEEAAKAAKILGAGIHELFRKSGKKSVEVDNIVVEFLDESEGTSPKYKEAFTQALTKVNLATLKVLQQILLENTKVTKISAQIRRSKGHADAVLAEGIFDTVKGKVLDWYNRILAKYKSLFEQKEKAQDAFIVYYSNLSDIMSKDYKMKHHIAESTKPQIKLSKLFEAIEKKTGKKIVLEAKDTPERTAALKKWVGLVNKYAQNTGNAKVRDAYDKEATALEKKWKFTEKDWNNYHNK